jgi:tetratricopeptide (TPR) repeat protein
LTDLNIVLEQLEVLSRGDQLPQAYLERGRISRGRGDLAGAHADFDRALALTSDADPIVPLILSERGVVKRALGDLLGSWQDFTHAVLLAPDPLLYLDPAIASVEHAGTPLPVRTGETLDLSHPGTPTLLYFARGVVRRRRGEWDLAMRDFDRALALLPDDYAPLLPLVDRVRRPDWDPLNPFAGTER